MRAHRVPASPVPGGFGFPLGFLATILATIVAVAAGATTQPLWALAALAGVVLAIAAISTPSAIGGTAAASWALHSGVESRSSFRAR